MVVVMPCCYFQWSISHLLNDVQLSWLLQKQGHNMYSHYCAIACFPAKLGPGGNCTKWLYLPTVQCRAPATAVQYDICPNGTTAVLNSAATAQVQDGKQRFYCWESPAGM